MTRKEQILSSIADWENAKIIWKDALDYADKHKVFADQQYYTYQINLADENIDKLEAELLQLKSA